MALLQNGKPMARGEQGDDTDDGLVEFDPSGRYGRYGEVLGRGACKTVYRAFDEVEGIEVAWNQVRMQGALQSSDVLERLYSEVHLLKTLRHKNIIKFYHSWVDTDRKNLNFITEIFTSGTLRQYQKKHKRVNIKALKNWSRQILRGLLYLHSHDPPIIHRDLKCDNIFINGNQGEVKIGDLGLATILRQETQATHSIIGTPEFMAPELYEEEYNELVDIYSFGMCLLEMTTFEYPYSECNSAAEIYKKVTSGKKPAALNKVNNSELRGFIEKCLAKASKRLSARELLMDPFFHLEGVCQTVSHSSHSNLTITSIDDLDDVGLLIKESNERPDTMQIHHKQRDCLSANYAVPSSPAASECKTFGGDQLDPIIYFHTKEDKRRSIDVSVKGKRGIDDTVFLRLRIIDSEDQVRNIHFPFDIECDTAMSVASEMVAELDLTDQDVSKIAEMIDVAILALVPEWKFGVAIDEDCSDKPEAIIEPHCSVSPSERNHPRPQPSAFWSNPRVMVPDGRIATRLEGTMHGRFEEVMYHHHRPVLTSYLEEGGTTSSGSSGILNGPGCWDYIEDLDYHGLPVRDKSCLGSVSAENCLLSQMSEENKAEDTSNDHVVYERNSGLCGIRKTTMCGDPYSAQHPINHSRLEDNFCWWKTRSQGAKVSSSLPSLDILSNLQDVDDTNADTSIYSVAEELRELHLKHERELRELQCKHEAAFLQLRNKWRQKRSSCLFASSPNKQQSSSSFSSLDSEPVSHAELLNLFQVKLNHLKGLQ